jgi:DNA polymerase I-like protein with 3'-5' exonuclease and polymerase domains
MTQLFQQKKPEEVKKSSLKIKKSSVQELSQLSQPLNFNQQKLPAPLKSKKQPHENYVEGLCWCPLGAKACQDTLRRARELRVFNSKANLVKLLIGTEEIYNYCSKTKIDVLLLLEHPEKDLKTKPFYKYCDNLFRVHKLTYGVIHAVGCASEDYKINEAAGAYVSCKKQNVKEIIDIIAPKIIVTTGRAIYSITENTMFKIVEAIKQKNVGGHFFVPINKSELGENNPLKDWMIDDSWLYSKEFNCKVFPIAPLYKTQGFDNYEWKWSKDQLIRAIKATNERPIRKQELKFTYIDDPNKFIQELINNKSITAIAIDTETSGFNYFEDTLHNISLSYDGITGYFLPFDKIDKALLNSFFSNIAITWIYQNAQFDLKFLRAKGISEAKCTFDTMLAAHVLNENSPNSLKALAWIYTTEGGYEAEQKQWVKDYKLKEHKVADFSQMPTDILVKYACYDAIITYQLYTYFLRRLDLEDSCVKEDFYQRMMPAVEMITDIEMTGTQIDKKELDEYAESLKIQALGLKSEIYTLANKEFNLKSNLQLGEVVANFLNDLSKFRKLPESEKQKFKTKAGTFQVNKEAMNCYADFGLDFAKKIIVYNHLTKELSQFGIKLNNSTSEKEDEETPEFLNIEDADEIEDEAIKISKKGFVASIYKGRLYGGYKLYGTKTGRMSGGGGLNATVNFQNMPKTPSFRKIFLPSEGFVLVEQDYQAMEIRIGSQISGKGPLEDLILNDKDMHCYTGAKVAEVLDRFTIATWMSSRFVSERKLYEHYGDKFDLYTFFDDCDLTYEGLYNKTKIEGQEEKLLESFRGEIKTVNFSAFYGSTGFGLGQQLKIDSKVAEQLLEAFYDAYPEYKQYMDEYKKFCGTHGYVTTMYGRKRRLPRLTYRTCKTLEEHFGNMFMKKYLGEMKSILSNQVNASINAPIQGTSGQTTILAMGNIRKEFKKKNMKSRILNNVHDSIVSEFYIPEIEEAIEISERWMSYPYYKNKGENKVQLTVDTKLGEIWGFGKSWAYWKNHPNEWKIELASIQARNDELKKYIEKV